MNAADSRRGWWPPSFRTVVGVVVTVVALLFVFQNTDTSGFHFLFFDIKGPKWLWLLGVFVLGFAAGVLFARHRSRASAA